MRVSFRGLTALVLLLWGCSTKTHMVPLGPAGKTYPPVPADSVFVFVDPTRLLVEHQPIAVVSAGLGYMNGTEEDSVRLEEVLRREAGRIGAHGVVLGGNCTVADQVRRGSGMPSGCATAVRFLHLGELSPGAVHRSSMTVSRIVIAPLAIPGDLAVPDAIVAGFLGDLRTELQEAGFEALPLESWEAAWLKANPRDPGPPQPTAAWGIVDPGEEPEQRALKVLVRDYGAQAFLFPDLVGVEAPFSGEEARWDGTRQKVGETRSTGAKVLSGILNLLIKKEENFEEPDPEGSVAALSLAVEIENVIGARLYGGRGGIELLQKADFEGGIYVTTGEKDPEGYQIVDVPDDELFQRRNRLRRAVRLALGPLIHSHDPGSSKENRELRP